MIMDLRWKSLVITSRESLIDLSGTGYRCSFSFGARYYFDLDLLADSLYFSSSVLLYSASDFGLSMIHTALSLCSILY